MSAPLGDAQHVCFICLQTDTEEPNGPWVNPCPCSLEAHQNCMLQWIAESEYEAARSVGNRRSPLKCPACKARIRLEEPHDNVVALYNKFLRGYSRVSPMLLLSIVSGGTVIGSAWYGMTAFSIFAGPRTALRWLGLRPLLSGRRDVSAWHAALSTLVKLTQLSLIGPTLISLWAVPASVVLSMPASVMFAATLITQDNVPSWPPSPQWAMVGLPYVHMVYEFVYNRAFSSLERRLNRALRGRPPTETPEDLAAQQAAPAANRAADEDRRNHNAGAWDILNALGGLAVALFRDPRQPNADGDGDDVDGEAPEVNHIQIEVDIGGPVIAEEDADDDVDPAAQEEVDAALAAELAAEEDEAVDEEEDALADDAGADANDEPFQIVNDAPAADEPAPADVPEDPPAQAPEAAEQQPPPPAARARARVPRHRPRRRNRQNNNAAAANDDDFDAEPRLSVFSIISNGIATTLLLPVISYAAGELVRALVPLSWTHRVVSSGPFRRPTLGPITGLLQMRWGRSLVGACLYYVLRDAFSLFYKYRKVQVKTHRRVKNVKRKAGEEHTAAPGTV